ncbi:polysaccharide biosynthesis tyrosine autokinase [Demequina sp. SYSU T00039]|uniref:non-specific protein-tyrosine kinase n=1 Tax=Demequina lignilytica TaxID=3051663 RepID=A0AAW7M158_9MICO|nr:MULTISPECIES: polysaccharide biosynthesis tyrosine autokinase [unclassified Demequina]MDN4477431.1 polysaccharide biosynthesis tyrosine autokinase [Demequina sp. SYSU T00039-1]MDN4488218.1 polysaccharide biosynthesis tyrosine autokinase [Demequina sp. SYSU T00039]
MELHDYLRVLRKNWLLIVLLTALGAGAGFAYSLLATPVYTATAKVFVSTSGASTVSDLATGSNFTQQRVKTYADLLTTSAVLQPTIDSLGIETSVASLRGRLSASTPLNTSVINISVSDSDPVFAASLATEASNQLIDVVEDIETTDSGEGSPVSLTLVQAAEVPDVPVSPNKTLNVALGLLLGLAVGVGIALLRATLDTRIRNERDLERVVDAPVLGGIVFDPKAKSRPLIVHEDAKSPRAESFRTLRTNLQFLDAERSSRSFVITSSIPSEGKSTTAANLAITLAEAGARVLLVGADLRRPKMGSYMGIEAGTGLTDVLIGRLSLDDAIQRWGRTDLYLLPAGSIPPNPSELLGSSLMASLITDLDERFDVVLYDAPPLLPVTDAAVLARLVGGTVLIVAAGKTHAPQLDSAVAALETVGAPVSGLVLTMLPSRGPDAYGYGRYGYVYGDEEPAKAGKK